VALVAIVAAVIGGCTDFSTTPVSLGRVTVAVTDQNNQGVPQLVTDLMLTDRSTIWRSIRTSSNGTGEFGTADGGVIPQQYIVRLTTTGTEYSLAEGETNDKPVTVIVGQIHPVTFKVKKNQVGGEPGGS
jgi:hypothetical protein